MAVADVETILRDDFGLAITASNFKKSRAPAAILDVRAKRVLGRFGVDAVLVAKNLDPAILPDDLLTVIGELDREHV